jgi:hypothetical protein
MSNRTSNSLGDTSSKPARAVEFEFVAPEAVRKIEKTSLAIGVLGAIACIAGAVLLPSQHFLRSYLLGYMLWLGVTLGSMAILMLAHLTSARWGFVVRRILEAASLNIFMMALLFIPLIAGVPKLYVWARADVLASDPLIQHQHAYLNPGAFIVRASLYFVVWCTMALLFNRWSWEQDSPPDRDYRSRYQRLSAVGLSVYVLTMTFAAIDWMMSLDPHWHSTIYGFYVIAGQGLVAFAFVLAMTALLTRYQPLGRIVSVEHVHDLAKLMLAFLILWAYMAFSQGLIYWSANLPSEISWYLDRTRGGWWVIGVVLIVLHFVAPFLVLLSQDLKRDAAKVAVVALWLMVMRWVDLYWLIIPSFDDTKGHLHFSWMDVASTLGIGGLWVALFFYNLKLRPLVPLHDPMLSRVLEQEHGH